MDLLQLATLGRHLENIEGRSALPDAPTVADDAVRFSGVRAVAAGVLHRVADLVAPEPATVRPRLAGGRGNWQLRWDESPCKPSPTASA
jgi:hypothetical protein